MAQEKFPKSQIDIRKTAELLPRLFQTESNKKFMSGAVDPLVQPGSLEKIVGYIGRRYGKTFNSSTIYLDEDQTLRSRYQLEPGVVVKKDNVVQEFYDYLDFKNQLKFFNNNLERDDLITAQEHYSWNPPIDWDKFINYREYFWVPEGPPVIRIFGGQEPITSTYTVATGVASTWVFTPDGFTNNPDLVLYRGQTYKFKVNAPGDGFFIRNQLDTGTLLYNPNLPYSKEQLIVFGGKIYRASENIATQMNPIPVDQDSRWELIDSVTQNTFIDYNQGITNNGVENGVLTFEVPYDSPDILFYQSLTDVNRFGRFIIGNIESNTVINIEKEIVGKATYTSSNGIAFSNGMVLKFEGRVTPEQYSKNTWLVEGVGNAITLTNFQDLVVSKLLTTDIPEVLFDNEGFDSEPFDDASAYPSAKDYITISKSSIDANPWSRYNRWFHRSVLEQSHNINRSNFSAPETARAKRPIIEFKPNLQLFNHGSIKKQTVDYIDDFTDDVFSTIEGSQGYNVDGEELFQGARVLVIADTDSLANNKIYTVNFIVHNGRRQISLLETDDSESLLGQGVLIRRGLKNQGLMYHFNGTGWVLSQPKETVNQPPLFDLFDENGFSFSDGTVYPVTSFTGSEIVSYKKGSGPKDKELGFSLSYLNIDNVGDIEFEFNFDVDKFQYQIDQELFNKKLSTGFSKINLIDKYDNFWIRTEEKFLQPIIDSIVISENTNTVVSAAINWRTVKDTEITKILFYRNGQLLENSYTRNNNVFTFDVEFIQGDVVSIKVFCDAEPLLGYYEIPVGLEKNPLNNDLRTFTLGQAVDHLASAMELTDEFTGSVIGSNNLRDLNGYQSLFKRFLKHTGPTPLALLLLCDKDVNVIKSIQSAKNSYSQFKNTFVRLATILDYDQDPVAFVDRILDEISKSKNKDSAFFASDMLGNGAFTKTNYIVEDEGIKTFALLEKFDLVTLSNKAVYVYLNNVQLLHGKEYDFNSTFGFVNLLVDLNEGDVVEIKEYVSTANNFIPPTPTKLGLYKKFTPRKFIDDSYIEPREMIQGHDGSKIAAYGDFRDDVLLELEYRIYNNIKQEYDAELFDIDKTLGGYYGSSIFDKQDLDSVIFSDFLRWASKLNVDYIENDFFDSENPFTYTYSNMLEPSRTQNLPGFWRGVYLWFYDTATPHLTPWEMLGFSQQPDWWESEYGPAPYTSNNLILWEDLRDGVVRKGDRAGVYDRYKRSSIIDHIPVDGDGNLLDPLTSGLAKNFVLINNQGNFDFGDVSPTEYAWRTSSEYPFAIVSALCLLKPFEYISKHYKKSKLSTNIIGQTVNVNTGIFINLLDLTDNSKIVSGLYNYVLNFVKGNRQPESILTDKLQNIDVLLSNRISGFVDQEQQKYLLDSKNPSSTSSSIFIPPENYDIIFDVSTPISSVAYSGVVIEKVNRGWKIVGYDSLDPIFRYFSAVPTQSDPVISVGGVSESFLIWEEDKFYGNGQLVRFENKFYRSIRSHTSERQFDPALWNQIPRVPLVGAIQAIKRRNFNRLSLEKLPYGTVLESLQAVVDFLLGYEEYQKFLGIVFDGYDTETQTVFDWTTSAKEFLFWTKHNWAEGSLISLSPCAARLEISVPIGVADNLLDSFYDYQVYKNDGTPLDPKFIDVSRDFQKVTVSTTDTDNGIYFIKLFFVLKEHVVLFDDRTIFNDVIYDKTTGYRQDKIKARGFRTVDWDGDYTSPGFVFDNVDISVWQPFVDYRLGDIVSYKSFFWTSRFNQIGSEFFNDANWTKLDLIPKKGLVANFDYRINQFEDYFDVGSDGVGSSQRELARHSIGYQQRDYLQDLAEDEVTQFKLYQGFIREKGTSNAIVKVFDKLNKSGNSGITLNEEWAFKLGTFGGVDQNIEYEFKLPTKDFKLNPQPVVIQESRESTGPRDRYIRVAAADFVLSPQPFSTDINLLVDEYTGSTRNAGYVKRDQVRIALGTRNDILLIPIDLFSDNDHFWIAYDQNSWTVLRYNEAPELRIIGIETDRELVTLTLNRNHNLSIDDIVGLRQVAELNGFFQIVDTTRNTIVVQRELVGGDLELSDSTFSLIGIFTEVRYQSYKSIDPETIALLKNGAKLWIDSNENSKWEVVEKTPKFRASDLNDYGITSPVRTGTAVLYFDIIKQVIASVPGSGFVLAYTNRTSALAPTASLGLKQIIPPPAGFVSAVDGVFGEVLAKSPDERWLAVGSPNASGVRSKFRGELNSLNDYLEGEIVLYQGKLWEALDNIPVGDGSSIDFNSQDWKPATLVEANPTGRNVGYFHQGMVTLYVFVNSQWQQSISLVSPRQADNERFGSAVSIGVSGKTYYMAVSAIGSLGNKGRVYLYYYDGVNWSHLENVNYAGLYDSAKEYVQGNIVWFNNSLYQATVDTIGEQDLEASSNWRIIDPVSTQNSLPQNASLEDDGSTLALGLLSLDQLSELIKDGDEFGHSLAMNRDATLLVIGVPNSDGQYFNNYKGTWDSYQEYFEGDVVKIDDTYFKLIDINDDESTITSKNENPLLGLPWAIAGDATARPSSGKVFIYRKTNQDLYVLEQTITSETLKDISELSEEVIGTGDQFGFDVDIDWSGTTLIVSSPQADIDFQNQGSVYIFEYNTDSTVDQFRLVQKLQSFENYTNEYFGSSICISPLTEKIVVGAKNSPFNLVTGFVDGTTFDFGTTRFSDPRGYTGQVYVFEKRDTRYFLTEKLEPYGVDNESFGNSVDCTDTVVVAGSPTFRNADGDIIGRVRLFTKDQGSSGLKILATQRPVIDIESLNNIELYDNETNIKIRDIDIVDGYKLKILGIAEQELSYKTVYDPAIYSFGPEEVVVDEDQAWFEKNVGKLWWDLSTTKFINYEQGDADYRIGNWNRLAEGSRVDVYEWVETPLLPSEWSLIADTAEGLSLGISGQPKFSDDTVYNEKVKINPTTGQRNGTLYYYWVRSSTIVPQIGSRRTPCSSVIELITSPISTLTPFAALIDKDKILLYNFETILSSESVSLNIQYKKDFVKSNPVHNEYLLLTEGVADSLPNQTLETKWIDSLLGIDSIGNRIPDTDLPEKRRYGVSYRPRQSMFVNKFQALDIVVNNINKVLTTQPFSDLISFNRLNDADPAPIEELNLYDVAIDAQIDLQNVGTVRVRQAILSPNIINGEIDTIDIIDSGFGYRTIPPVVIQGTGKDAKAEVTLDNQGRVSSVRVLRRGRRYSSAVATVRPFSVLVRADETSGNFWSLYSWDQQRRTFFRSASQSYNVAKYWNFADWWKEGFGEESRIVSEIEGLFQEPTITLSPGDLLRIKEYAIGGWAVLEKTNPGQGDILGSYNLIGRQNGTIQITPIDYSQIDPEVGYDSLAPYDTAFYDFQNSKEYRIILEAVKNDIFTDTLRVEWNKVFFNSIRYAFSEQLYVNWAFKTSFVNATHNVGDLEQKTNYKSDSLDSFRAYLEEVKPFRTTIREYVSKYNNLDNADTAMTDFDLPPAFSAQLGKFSPINQENNRFEEYPWKWWTDNLGYSIVEIIVADSGSDYVAPPQVVIEGDGIGAEAQAYIANGRLTNVRMISQGTGYTKTPMIKIVGGNGSSSDIARAVAILGNSNIRTFDTTIKFDRLSKQGIYNKFVQEQTFVATGSTSVFELNYAPTRDKTKIKVVKNNRTLLGNEYSIDLFRRETQGRLILQGKIILTALPEKDDVINVVYEKNDELLDSVNRIDKYYNPSSGMKGKELPQLMTGIDFGGVQIQGTTFDVTGGWDALPWFTDNWDSVESSNDFYYVVDFDKNVDSSKIYKPGALVEYQTILYVNIKENVNNLGEAILPVQSIGWEQFWQKFQIKLPFVPESGQAVSVYLKPQGGKALNIQPREVTLSQIIDNLQFANIPEEPRTVRIDDPFFDAYDGSTIQPNGKVVAPDGIVMPTVIGDGITDTVDIQEFLILSRGDTLIFRLLDSDGSVTITDVNLLDTRISGGSLSSLNNAYTTATGTTAEEIVVDGEKFISPDQVPAPEENIPGQVLDSVSIKVYNTVSIGATPIANSVSIGDGIRRLYDIGLTVFESASVIVYIDKIKQEFSVDTTSDYTINFRTNQIEFITAPALASVIEIISIGLGGTQILDYQEFLADGDTNLFLTKALYEQTGSVIVSVNGNFIDTGFINSSDVIDTENRTMIQFGTNPPVNSVIKIISLRKETENQIDPNNLIRVNNQTVTFDGSTKTFDLDNFVNLSTASAVSSILVNLNDNQLIGVDTIYQVYNGTNNNINVGVDPNEAIGTITSGNIKVFINNILQRFVTDYIFNGNLNLISIPQQNLTIGDIIRIEVDVRAEYTIQNNSLTISSTVPLQEGDTIEITWFSDYPSMNIVSDEYTGGKVNYKLARIPLSADYIWVYKNGIRLTKDRDFSVSLQRGVVYLNESTTVNDQIKIVQFAREIYQQPRVYEIFKDMLNNYHYKRYSKDNNLRLTKELRYFDTTIEISDGSLLSVPQPLRNIPGVIYVNSERIEYMSKVGNILGQLRRGSLGTGISEFHEAGSYVVDVGSTETLPYTETQEKADFISDGSSLLIGPLNFVPVQSIRNQWFKQDIPLEYGPCDEVEVFVAGRRLKKDPVEIYDEDLGADSPSADVTIQAEFSVDGQTPFIRLSNIVPAGILISIVRKQGKTWYERGENTASAGKFFLENNTPIINFIAKKGSELPE